MVLIDLIFLIVLTNALTGAIYLRIWSAVSGCLEEKSDYISIYRWLRLGLFFYILPGLAVVFAGDHRALAVGMRQSEIFSPMKIAAFLIFAAALVWMGGMVVNLCRYLREIRTYCRICENNEEIGNDHLQDYYEEICRRQGIYKTVSVYANPEIDGPVVFGVFYRRILLPESCVRDQELQIILEHEMIHIKHKDLLWERLAAIISLIIWFLPQPKRMLTAMEDWSETVCDISVCASGVSVWSVKKYFDLVIRLAGDEERAAPGTVMAFGGGESSAIRKRILRVKRFTGCRSFGHDRMSASEKNALVHSASGEMQSCAVFAHDMIFLPRRRSMLLAFAIMLLAVFGVWQAGRKAAVQVTTDHLVLHTMLWSDAGGSADVRLRGNCYVRAGGSGYQIVYLNEKSQIKMIYEASGTRSVKSGAADNDEDSGVFGSVSIYQLFGEPQMNCPAVLAGGTVSYAVQESGWYVVRWENARVDTGITVDYVITR